MTDTFTGNPATVIQHDDAKVVAMLVIFDNGDLRTFVSDFVLTKDHRQQVRDLTVECMALMEDTLTRRDGGSPTSTSRN